MDEKLFKVHSKTVGADGLKGTFDLENSMDYYSQDISKHLADAKLQRDMEEYYGREKKSGMRKMATIPDIVALRILQDHDLDLHDPAFMSNPANLTKLKKILLTEYRDLVINT